MTELTFNHACHFEDYLICELNLIYLWSFRTFIVIYLCNMIFNIGADL